MKVVWTGEAVDNLESIHRWISNDAPDRALKVVQGLRKNALGLTKYPYKGRMVPEFNRPMVRELIRPPFRLVYAVEEREIRILSVYHDRQALEDRDR